jgi:peptide/nickel transport system permease protein
MKEKFAKLAVVAGLAAALAVGGWMTGSRKGSDMEAGAAATPSERALSATVRPSPEPVPSEGFDALMPPQMAARAEATGVRKARQDTITMLTLGVLAAWKADTWVDRLLMVVSVLGFSVPGFVVGYLLIYLFAIELRWLPVQGYTPIAEGVVPWARNLVLPSVTLGLAYVALIARITRASMLDVLAEDYIRTAKAKGVANQSMLLKHALKNAGVPIVTVIGIGVALLFSGVVITETVFNIPGIGRLVVDAIAKRDYPIIQGVILIFSGVYVLVNLIVDLSYTLIDPRIRY